MALYKEPRQATQKMIDAVHFVEDWTGIEFGSELFEYWTTRWFLNAYLDDALQAAAQYGYDSLAFNTL